MRILNAGRLALLSLLLIGCADGGRTIPSRATEDRSRAVEPVMVRVTNHNRLAIDVSVYMNDQSIRLGQIEAGGVGVFMLPRAARAADLQLVADPRGADQQYATGPILVSPGGLIELTVENSLGLSSFTVSGT